MSNRILSVSAAPYDGYPLGATLDSLAACGVSHVEPAYIVGYTEPFTEDAFAETAATAYRRSLAASGLRCHAVSAHMDLGTPEALEIFRRRMDFARSLGAGIINTNASLRVRATQFHANIDALAQHGASIGLTIGLENPGNGEDNLFNTAADGLALVRAIGSPQVRLNFDPGNRVSQVKDDADPAAEGLLALPSCAHFHIKDVKRRADGWYFVTPGTGDIDYRGVFSGLAGYPVLPISIEIPLRIHRGPNALPMRRPAPVPLAEIEQTLRAGLHHVRTNLSDIETALTRARRLT
jgi:sugar phosphate isomerase/epimerase